MLFLKRGPVLAKIYFTIQLFLMLLIHLFAGVGLLFMLGLSAQPGFSLPLAVFELSSLLSLLALIVWFIRPLLGWQLHVAAMVLASLSSFLSAPIFLIALFISVKIKDKLLLQADEII